MPLLAKDVMETPVRTVAPTISLLELDRLFLETGTTGLPVIEHGRLVGLVSRSDIVAKLSAERTYAEYLSEFPRDVSGFGAARPRGSLRDVAARVGIRLEEIHVRDMMTDTPVTVAANDPLRDVAAVMVEHRIHRALVTRDDCLAGIITSFDFVRLAAEGRLVPAERGPADAPRP